MAKRIKTFQEEYDGAVLLAGVLAAGVMGIVFIIWLYY